MKNGFHYFVPAAAVALCSLFIFSSVDKKVNDICIRTLPELKEDKSILLVDIDDDSVENIGVWPWSRDIIADTIVYMRELGAESVVFDLSYLDKSPKKVNMDFITTDLPDYINSSFDDINNSVESVIEGIDSQKVGTGNLDEGKRTILKDSDRIRSTLLSEALSGVSQDVDSYFADCITLFNNAYLTLTFDEAFSMENVDTDYLSEKIAIENITAENDTLTPEIKGVMPAIDMLLKKAKKAGFVNSSPDKDLYRRRIDLFIKHNGKYYGQLVLVPLLNRFGNPDIVISNERIVLKNAKINDKVTKDIIIPRGQDGKVLLRYPNKKFVDYNHVNVWSIYRMKVLESEFLKNLSIMEDSGFFGEDFFQGETTPLQYYEESDSIREILYKGDGENSETYKSYLEAKENFYSTANTYLNGESQQIIVDACGDDTETIEFVNECFDTCRMQFTQLVSARKDIAAKLKNATCIVGTCASSTTDYGLTMYEENYPNVGIHSSVANMILSEDFIDDSPWFISVIIALILCYSYSFITKKLDTVKQILIGIFMVAGSTVILWLFFYITRTYLGIIIPFASLSITYISIIVLGFLTASKDKKFITNAFSQCLSKDVVNDIISNPSSLKLGGVTRVMSAIFTDIQKFSTFSELLNAAQLVALLNYYLTKMSDIIMEERGTVDKYEGDAIIALVGAPLEMEDHAIRACRAAIKMKKSEVDMNKEIYEIGKMDAKPENIEEDLFTAFKIMVKNGKTIYTRVGINSGEMVAGFMGSENKKNYTMMGNNVNLASRLEGVNKQYFTHGILVSETTRNLCNKDDFVFRSLDRVRVVGVSTPLRLYELLDEKSSADEKMLKGVEKWESAMILFEKKEYKEAYKIFKALNDADNTDNVSKFYMDRCVTLYKNPRPADWDGVFNLTEK